MLRNMALLAAGMALIALPGPAAAMRKQGRFDYCAHQHAVFSQPRPFIGITDKGVFVGPERYRNCSFGWMASAGVGFYRFQLGWKFVELRPNQYDFTAYDRVVTDIVRHRLHFLPVLIGPTPNGLSTAPAQGAQPGLYPPKDPAQFARFVAQCVEHYGPHGTFWRANPTLPYLPVRAWQVWNEQNLKGAWEPRPNVSAYVRLLRSADRAIKGVDPHALVITGGTPFTGVSNETRTIAALYHHRARRYFDALAIHDYAPTVADAIRRLWTARRLLDRFGDGHKPLWVTEMGWSGGDPNGFITNALKQRLSVIRFFGRIGSIRSRLRLGEVMWAGWRDDVLAPPHNWWGYHLGFFTTDLRPKPALAAFSRAARRLDR